MSKLNLGDKPVEYAILALAIAAGVYIIVRTLTKAAGAAANSVEAGVSSVVGAGAGIATGNNVVTNGTPYQGAGIFGTLGAVTNDVLGGAPQAFGDWLASKTNDSYDPNADNGQSSSVQSASNNPYGAPSKFYASASNAAPVPATAVATPFSGGAVTDSW